MPKSAMPKNLVHYRHQGNHVVQRGDTSASINISEFYAKFEVWKVSQNPWALLLMGANKCLKFVFNVLLGMEKHICNTVLVAYIDLLVWL